jgi:hypothetical protein
MRKSKHLSFVLTLAGQLQWVLDVSASAHSQLERLRGRDRPRDSDDEDENEGHADRFLFRPKRLLRLQLSDGANTVRGAEIGTITALSLDTPPGTKVRACVCMCVCVCVCRGDSSVCFLRACTERPTDANPAGAAGWDAHGRQRAAARR